VEARGKGRVRRASAIGIRVLRQAFPAFVENSDLCDASDATSVALEITDARLLKKIKRRR